MNKCLFVILLQLMCSLTLADSVKDAAREMSGLASGAVETINNTSPEQFAPRYEGIPQDADQFYGGGNIIPKAQGSAKISGCENVAEEDLYKRQECEGINFVGKNASVRPDVTISSEEDLAKGTHKITSDPTDTLNKYGWKIPFNPDGSIGEIPAEACNTELITIPEKKVLKDCSVYQGVEQYLCETTLKVEVDPSFNYSCLETKYNNSFHDCSKKLSVTCERATTCANQGIKLASWQGDMAVSMQALNSAGVYRLTFGTVGDDYWNNADYSRTLTFDIVGKNDLTLFRLSRTEYDDWMYVEVNGTLVWSSDGNTRFVSRCPATGICIKPSRPVISVPGNVQLGIAERRTSWKKDLSIDLRPYLKEGRNTIHLFTVVGGGGEGNAMFDAQQYCVPNCSEKWQGCEDFESKVKS